VIAELFILTLLYDLQQRLREQVITCELDIKMRDYI